jgi:hypothetical protein
MIRVIYPRTLKVSIYSLSFWILRVTVHSEQPAGITHVLLIASAAWGD